MSPSKRASERFGHLTGRAARAALVGAALAVLPVLPGGGIAQTTPEGAEFAPAGPPAASEPAPQMPVPATGAGQAGDPVTDPAATAAPAAAPPAPAGLQARASAAQSRAMHFLRRGGPAIWAIAAVSVAALALILWKVWRLARMGAWTGGRRAREAVALWQEGNEVAALGRLQGRRSCRAALIRAAIEARRDPTLDDAGARAETERVARRLLAEAQDGLRALELIATIAPLMGLLGTVLGMIAAFQALQEAGSRADPALLAGGIREALLTTAAGMAVAIPASMALSWFESVADRLRLQMEDAATRIFLRPAGGARAGARTARATDTVADRVAAG